MRLIVAAVVALWMLAGPVQAAVVAPGPASVAGQTLVIPAEVKINPRQLLVRPRAEAPSAWEDPFGWINYQQRRFTELMRTSLREIRQGDASVAAWTLILLSFAYGIFHAAGPGHGKAVVSAWLLANERQLRRGVLIAFMAAIVQAVTAVVLVTGVLYAAKAAGSTARSLTGYLEAASYGLIALVGVYLIWQAISSLRTTPVLAVAGHGVANHGAASRGPASHHVHDHDHHHHHDHDHHHDENCGCGHAHLPAASELDSNWSLAKAFSLSVAVGIRPCSGAILALLASSALGIYWAGVISTFAMAIGVAITVSLIAICAVTARNVAFRLTGGNVQWMDRMAFTMKLAGGLFIAALGVLLFVNALENPMSFS